MAQLDSTADAFLAYLAEGGDFDYPRAVAGGLNVPFMSIYVPASYQETGGAGQLADELIDLVEGIVARHPEQFALAASVEDVKREVAGGKIVLAMGLENGAPIDASGELDDALHAAVLAEAVGHGRVWPLGNLGGQNLWMADGIRSLGGYHPAKLAAYEQVRQYFNEKELVDLSLAIVAINGWNRLSIGFRSEVGGYRPGMAVGMLKQTHKKASRSLSDQV